jgi:short-subunit dehydrogenase
MSEHLGTALITGASGGIGAVYAERLARRGHDLILVARNRDRLDALATRLTVETGRTIEILAADLGSRPGRQLVEERLRSDEGITMLINNAGIGALAPLEDSDVDAMERMIDVNVTALMRLTYAAVPAFLQRGRGTVINLSSIVGLAPDLLNGVYGASKAFVLAFTLSLQKELANRGVRVQAVLPGAVATELWAIAGTPVETLPADTVMTATDMVDAALAGLDLGEVVTIPSLPDAADWTRYESARTQLRPYLSRRVPAGRYRQLAAGARHHALTAEASR